jgi:hypothetical protein
MKPNPAFLVRKKEFWANIKTISESVGYGYSIKNPTTGKSYKVVKIPNIDEITSSYSKLGLGLYHIIDDHNHFTEFGSLLSNYYLYRARVLTEQVEPLLMDVNQAKLEFEKLRNKLNPHCPIPLNKQKGDKRAPAFFTGIINMLVEANSDGLHCDYDPHQLTTITKSKIPLRTLSRRVDGAFPSVVNPIAIWEIKEYYYTTTFGSRVADGVYESLLDGMELEELFEIENIKVKHYLMLDAHDTWWNDGISYLCRIIDMLHMGYVDEVLFGYEVFTKIPELVKEWVQITRQRNK